MSISPVNRNYASSIFNNAIQDASLTRKTNGNNLGGINASTFLGQVPDNSQLSPFAQLMSTLQELQQSDPAKYQEVTGQIATKLQDAAKSAEANGNTSAANRLNQLASDFKNASNTGQLPNVQDVGQTVRGHHHGGRHYHREDQSQDPAKVTLETLSNAGLNGSSADSEGSSPLPVITAS